MAKFLIFLLLTGICGYLASTQVFPLLLVVFRRRVRHRRLAAPSEPDGPAVQQARELGFAYLGSREERLGPWRRRTWCFACSDGVCLDLAATEHLARSYLATFWTDGAAVLTKVGHGRSVREASYFSSYATYEHLSRLLAEHHRAEHSVTDVGARILPRTIEERIAAAETWWRRHAQVEYRIPAVLGATLAAGAVALWVYGVAQLLIL